MALTDLVKECHQLIVENKYVLFISTRYSEDFETHYQSIMRLPEVEILKDVKKIQVFEEKLPEISQAQIPDYHKWGWDESMFNKFLPVPLLIFALEKSDKWPKGDETTPFKQRNDIIYLPNFPYPEENSPVWFVSKIQDYDDKLHGKIPIKMEIVRKEFYPRDDESVSEADLRIIQTLSNSNL